VLVGNVATPLAFSVPVPICVAPSRNRTVPVGCDVPLPPPSVAVNVTLVPVATDAAEVVNATVVGAAVTTVRGAYAEVDVR
jgi:hypothetical protein